MKLTQLPSDSLADAPHFHGLPVHPPVRHPIEISRTLYVVVDWDPTQHAKKLLVGGLVGVVGCGLGLLALDAYSGPYHAPGQGTMLMVLHLLLTLGALMSAWYFLKGVWDYMFA